MNPVPENTRAFPARRWKTAESAFSATGSSTYRVDTPLATPPNRATTGAGVPGICISTPASLSVSSATMRTSAICLSPDGVFLITEVLRTLAPIGSCAAADEAMTMQAEKAKSLFMAYVIL